MLQMKSLLRNYGITISLTDPDVHDRLIQAAETIDDEEIDFLRLRLMTATQSIHKPSTDAMHWMKRSPF